VNRVLELIKGPEFDSPYLGQKIGIAVLDTGIYSHPDFDNRVIAFRDLVHNQSFMYDDCGHGTHVSGIIAGSGSASDGYCHGVAPKANLIGVKVLDHKGNGNIKHLLEGIQWVIKHKDKYNIRIINISAGTVPKDSKEESSTLVKGVEEAWDKGIIVVTAAGNNGPKPMSITTPGISRKVITVGCSDDQKLTNVQGNKVVNYSGRGPTASCICKPDIVAPGSGIISCAAMGKRNSKLYCIKSGTSMATPIVSGAIAVLLSKYPYLTNVDVKIRLKEKSVDLGLPKNQQGWGMLDVGNLLS